jgi:hypothetical protein
MAWMWEQKRMEDGGVAWEGVSDEHRDATAVIVLTPRGWEATVADHLCSGLYLMGGIDPYLLMGVIDEAAHPSMWLFTGQRPANVKVLSIG